eukprot:g34042.t1
MIYPILIPSMVVILYSFLVLKDMLFHSVLIICEFFMHVWNQWRQSAFSALVFVSDRLSFWLHFKELKRPDMFTCAVTLLQLASIQLLLRAEVEEKGLEALQGRVKGDFIEIYKILNGLDKKDVDRMFIA